MEIAYVLLYLINPAVGQPVLVTQFMLTPDRAVEQCRLSVENYHAHYGFIDGRPELFCVPIYKPISDKK